MYNKLEPNFHGYYDVAIRPYSTKQVYGSYTTIQKRDLSYRFYLHSHPYVAELVRRLIQRSVPGLQASDTEYRTNNDGTWVTLPDGKPEPVLYQEIFTSTRYDPS